MFVVCALHSGRRTGINATLHCRWPAGGWRAVLRVGLIASMLALGSVPPGAAARGPTILGVRHSSAEDYTRVVIELSGRADHSHAMTAGDPPALVVAVARALIGPNVQDVTVGDGRIDRVRFLAPEAEGAPAQVLIELTVRVPVKVFSLPADSGKPQRLVIDVPGSGARELGPRAPAAAPRTVGARPAVSPGEGADTQGAPDVEEAVGSGGAAPAPGRTLVVVIDPGHGGLDPGARGSGGAWEKDVCLALGKSLAAELNRQRGIKAVLTRDRDTFLSLRRRTRLAAEMKGDLFVSIHANSNRSRRVFGTEIYFLSLSGASDAESREVAMRENAADRVAGVPPQSQGDIEDIIVDLLRTSTLERSSDLAATVIEHLREDQRLAIRGVKQAGFDVLKTAGMPSILIEAAFISHPKEAKLLKSRDFQQQFAKRAGAGIVEYLTRAAAAEARGGAVPLDSKAPDLAQPAGS